ncbi:PTS-dependent dihydroxyacetone kinase phosphotransferase subunit DhaM [Fusibacter paucivorans]|uniref:phosphoenolpyruvate--glycerone phosphotransferase n=1 Tax=Fusibacter paucivorans TaxID=76009 RepID=A0ABS5PLP8_9FIRM|nr:dihydroxyacetone kinase phosphoryl donor subunit DhaM [Fusibacter paucivorans]MBS7525978.1 PTS-dependent dihydroxyacetone kinase phosphotransferase subunit DhaM [Fusibacter paucivorans]
MVGIVIVSHSEQIAEGIKTLAGQMAGANQKIIAAGGMTDGSIGTDAIRISEAVAAADSGDGVLVLVDLGSAIISTETAFELIEPEVAARVVIADAPIVEGAISAAVQASIGATLAEVKAAAEMAKAMQKL